VVLSELGWNATYSALSGAPRTFGARGVTGREGSGWERSAIVVGRVMVGIRRGCSAEANIPGNSKIHAACI